MFGRLLGILGRQRRQRRQYIVINASVSRSRLLVGDSTSIAINIRTFGSIDVRQLFYIIRQRRRLSYPILSFFSVRFIYAISLISYFRITVDQQVFIIAPNARYSLERLPSQRHLRQLFRYMPTTRPKRAASIQVAYYIRRGRCYRGSGSVVVRRTPDIKIAFEFYQIPLNRNPIVRRYLYRTSQYSSRLRMSYYYFRRGPRAYFKRYTRRGRQFVLYLNKGNRYRLNFSRTYASLSSSSAVIGFRIRRILITVKRYELRVTSSSQLGNISLTNYSRCSLL